MSLKTGLYFIRNDGVTISRRFPEDRSLNPKAVVKSNTPIPPDLTVWEIRKLGSNPDTYTLSNRGNYTSPRDRMVWAILNEEPPAEKWVIKAVPQQGPNKYIITTNNQNEGWVAPYPDGDSDQVECHPLIVFPTEPPRFPDNEVFEIIPL